MKLIENKIKGWTPAISDGFKMYRDGKYCGAYMRIPPNQGSKAMGLNAVWSEEKVNHYIWVICLSTGVISHAKNSGDYEFVEIGLKFQEIRDSKWPN